MISRNALYEIGNKNSALTSPLDGSSSIALSFGKLILLSSVMKFCLGKVEEILWFDWTVQACFAGVDCANIGRPGDRSSTKIFNY